MNGSATASNRSRGRPKGSTKKTGFETKNIHPLKFPGQIVPKIDRGAMDKKQLAFVDLCVGNQVRYHRVLLGLSQETVAKVLKLTYQQLQKYEMGTNRISASRLYQLSIILHQPIEAFFSGIDANANANGQPIPSLVAPTEDKFTLPLKIIPNKETTALINTYYAIQDSGQRNAALRLIRALGKGWKERK